ncbi:SRPBCC family protein [Altererythrobacter luteolus]|uniref:SRPBCC family protein n=1 Tax=Pontixanthobacter luteolus TaxID=295089 RepID=A0A6I4UWM0_9SPHN|nr:SRPBCC family protein [Pontixanthobacter luteolus]MXP46267.1 SRPBCC family protein [Pontixanthobacter luteolus]
MTRFLKIAALGALAFSAPAQAEVIAETQGAFVTRDSQTVSADLRETWMLLISPAKWWNSAHTFSGESANMTLTPQAGGCFCERIPAKETASTIGLAGSVEHMSVVLAIPDQALRMEGALGPLQSEPVKAVLTVTLSESDAGTKIDFEYAVAGFMRFETAAIAKAVDGVISQQLNGLSEQLGPVAAAPEAEDEAVAEDGAEAADSGDADENPAEEAAEDPRISVDEAFGDLDPGN